MLFKEHCVFCRRFLSGAQRVGLASVPLTKALQASKLMLTPGVYETAAIGADTWFECVDSVILFLMCFC